MDRRTASEKKGLVIGMQKQKKWVFSRLFLLLFLCLAGCSYGRVPAGVYDALVVSSENGSLRVSAEYSADQEDTAAENNSSENSRSEGKSAAEPVGDTQEAETIAVYLCGRVRRPGVYQLPAGARLNDAVKAAGGLCADAQPEAVNLARYVQDGEKLYIPSEEEVQSASGDGKDSVWDSADGSGNGANMSGSDAGTSTNGLICVNTATKEELMQLPGIGEVRAEAILAYREANGPFGRPEDLMLVPGIKQAAYEKIKDRITVLS